MLDMQKIINSFPTYIRARLIPFFYRKGETVIRKGTGSITAISSSAALSTPLKRMIQARDSSLPETSQNSSA